MIIPLRFDLHCHHMQCGSGVTTVFGTVAIRFRRGADAGLVAGQAEFRIQENGYYEIHLRNVLAPVPVMRGFFAVAQSVDSFAYMQLTCHGTDWCFEEATPTLMHNYLIRDSYSSCAVVIFTARPIHNDCPVPNLAVA